MAYGEGYKYSVYRRKYNIPDSFKFGGGGTLIYGDGDFSIGENSYMNLVSIQVEKGQKVQIGRNCRFAHNIRIYTTSIDPDSNLDVDPWGAEQIMKKGDVIIGNAVWVGANVFINPNVTIGDNVVIGANSIVTKNIESNSIVGGVPAKLIRYKNSK